MKTLCVLGSINIDHVIRVPYFPKAGETLQGTGYQTAFGGKGANQAVAAARLRDESVSVQFIGAVGDDEIGKTMKQAFAAGGIDVRHIHTVANQSTGLAMIQVASSGENSIVISAGANGDLDEKRVEPLQAEISQADLLLIQLETPVQAVKLAASFAKKAGKKVMLNPAPAQALSPDFLNLIDIITPNETEAEILTGVKVCDEATACEAANVFHQAGIQTVLITLGAKGVFISQNGSQKILQGFKVESVDTTAAGDTFNGALAVGLLEGKTLDQAIQFAQASAALSVTKQGAQSSVPRLNEVKDFIVNREK